MGQLIVFDTAQLAKEIGFDLLTNHYFYVLESDSTVREDYGDGDYDHACLNHNKYDLLFSRPTQSDLQTWLRNVHKVDIRIYREYQFMIKNKNLETQYYDETKYESYEDALEIALQEAIKSIKNGKDIQE